MWRPRCCWRRPASAGIEQPNNLFRLKIIDKNRRSACNPYIYETNRPARHGENREEGIPSGGRVPLSSDNKKLLVANAGQRCAMCGEMFERYAVPHKGGLVCIECAIKRLNLSIFGLEVE